MDVFLPEVYMCTTGDWAGHVCVASSRGHGGHWPLSPPLLCRDGIVGCALCCGKFTTPSCSYTLDTLGQAKWLGYKSTPCWDALGDPVSIVSEMSNFYRIQFWQRQSNFLSFCWNTYTLSTADEIRQEYHGTPSIDPVTRKPNVYYPTWKRKVWYVFSAIAMLPLLSAGVAVMTLSLNLNGYVKSTDSPIYVEALARFAQPVSFTERWLSYVGNIPPPYAGRSVCRGQSLLLVASPNYWSLHLCQYHQPGVQQGGREVHWPGEPQVSNYCTVNLKQCLSVFPWHACTKR